LAAAEEVHVMVDLQVVMVDPVAVAVVVMEDKLAAEVNLVKVMAVVLVL
jgi:hypothetical protein